MATFLDEHPDARARVAQRRESVERLLELARYLPEADRGLLEQVFRRGATAVELSRLAGRPPRAVRERLRRLLRRVRHPLFAFTATHMDLVPHRSRPAIRLVVFHGLSLRAAARRRGISLHEIRGQVRAVRDLAHL